MAGTLPLKIKTITEAHRIFGLPGPEHPLISILNYADVKLPQFEGELSAMLGFYYISMKKGFSNKLFYGQQSYDFDEGMLYFVGPNQLMRGAGPEPGDDLSGWILLIHPDLLWGTSLAREIKKYDFFDYAVNEALFLSDKERVILDGIVETIKGEYKSNMDKFSQDIIVSHLETLLSYSERFYQRQFLTRKKGNHQVISRLEKLLSDYFDSERLENDGLPTVQYISESLNISTTYLRGLLKTLTGQTTQQHLSVSEIAYALGFEHPQSFSKLFKAKTSVSPLEFRQSFN